MEDNNNFEEDNYEEDYTDNVDNNDDFDDNYQRQPQKLGRGQKAAAIGLAIFGVFIIVLWMVQFKNSIRSPLNYSSNSNSSNNSSATASATSAQDEAALKAKDTDGDGLSDWDELNIYHTSPYLADSDSDGILDGVEVKNGTDPNCPTGRDCSAPIYNADANMSNSASSTPSATGQSNTTPTTQTPNLNLSASSTHQQELQNALSGQTDAATLRQLLIQAGMDKNTLDQISDQELMQSYQDTLNQAATQSSGVNTGQ